MHSDTCIQSVVSAARRILVFMAVTLAACGGGGAAGGGDEVTPPPVTPPPTVAAPTANQIALVSDPGDSLGQGRSYTYTSANASIEITVRLGLIHVEVAGDEDWQGDFQLPDTGAPRVAAFENALYYPTPTSSQASMRWYGMGRGCATARGSFWIDHVGLTYDGLLRSLILRFERYCDGSAAAIRGQINWLATDPTTPPAVVDPPPDTLWRPAASALPASGNYVHLVSEVGDVVGQGRTRTFTQSNSLLSGAGGSSYFEAYVDGDQSWYGILSGRETAQNSRLQRGYYPELTRYPMANPTRGGLAWVGQGRGCADVRGWAAIDRIEYDSIDRIEAIEYRFEQRCTGSAGALRGAVRWTKADADGPSTPSTDTTPGSWRPPAGSTPASGSYVYLNGEAGDSISAGSTQLFTPSDATFAVVEAGGALRMTVAAQYEWSGNLRAIAGGAPLRSGVYANLPNGQLPNDTQPYFNWTGRNRGCGTSLSWLAIDNVVYAGGELTSIDFRFEQRCRGLFNEPAIGALRGEVHWRADDLRQPLGPKPDAPANFWRPAAGALPGGASVSYLHVDSMRSDFIGAGRTTTYTQANAGFSVLAMGNHLQVDVTGDQTWSLEFQGIAGRNRLEPGYYEDVKRFPSDPARGGMDVSSDARGCNALRGGFIIDSVSYSAGGDLSDLQMRFEQHCEGSTPSALWGEFRWAQDDTTVPPGPIAPPVGLWQPAASELPSSGNYLYFQSLDGDFIGGGNRTLTLTPADATFTLFQGQAGATATLEVNPGGYFPWRAEFKVMSSLTHLQPGYYGGITGHTFQNPAKGGLSFSGDGHACNDIDGWFVIDDVSYVGDTITSLQAHFEQVCDGVGLLRAKINWQKP